LGGCLQQEYEGEQKSNAHRHDPCGMPTVVTFDDDRSRGHSQSFGLHVFLAFARRHCRLEPVAANSDIQADEAFGRNGA
jgi:hypothetical protein